ncbi:hypothetical protein BCF44_105273 [Kutzneria buriramensis]|uniref:Uncharacterized protein n=1 Tax=Kutzneria buriramensis TaxID=1045776 RepID=A0A3E0HR03_9PSEU|nr:hypothetical protein BCF44_105273 [Kutzneria buriramensis]
MGYGGLVQGVDSTRSGRWGCGHPRGVGLITPWLRVGCGHTE